MNYGNRQGHPRGARKSPPDGVTLAEWNRLSPQERFRLSAKLRGHCHACIAPAGEDSNYCDKHAGRRNTLAAERYARSIPAEDLHYW